MVLPLQLSQYHRAAPQLTACRWVIRRRAVGANVESFRHRWEALSHTEYGSYLKGWGTPRVPLRRRCVRGKVISRTVRTTFRRDVVRVVGIEGGLRTCQAGESSLDESTPVMFANLGRRCGSGECHS